MSMLLFALVLNPLICLSERQLTGIRTALRITKTAVVAYADDVTIFVTAPVDIQIIGDLLLTYKRATDARLNNRKSKPMAAGPVGHIDGHAGLRFLSGNIHTCLQIHEYSSPFTECRLVEDSREGQSPGERRLLTRLMSKTTNQNVHNFLLSTHHRFSRPRRSTSDNSLMAASWYMAWCGVQGATISLTTPDGGRRYGLDRCSSQMPCPLSYQILYPS